MKTALKITWKIVQIIGIILLVIVIVVAAMYLYADNAPVLGKNFTDSIKTGGDIEEHYLHTGGYETTHTTVSADAPIHKYTIYYPCELEENDKEYPMVLLVNGTGGKATKYKPLLEQLASWGFIVVGTQDKGTGTGETTIQALNYMLRENETQSSIFYGKIDVDNIGVTGHSQGGAATIRAITMYEESHYFKTAVPLSPVSELTAEQTTNYPYDCADINCPIFLLAGTSGEFEIDIVIPFEQMEKMYDKITVPKIMARRVDMTHDDMLYKAEGYVTAWFMWQLQGDENAARAFVGENPELLTNTMYQDQKIDCEVNQ